MKPEKKGRARGQEKEGKVCAGETADRRSRAGRAEKAPKTSEGGAGAERKNATGENRNRKTRKGRKRGDDRETGKEGRKGRFSGFCGRVCGKSVNKRAKVFYFSGKRVYNIIRTERKTPGGTA